MSHVLLLVQKKSFRLLAYNQDIQNQQTETFHKTIFQTRQTSSTFMGRVLEYIHKFQPTAQKPAPRLRVQGLIQFIAHSVTITGTHK